MSGATRLPWQLGILFSFYGAFYTVLGWPGLLPLPTVAALYGGKVLCQTLFLAITLRQARHRERLGVLLLYDGYLMAMSLAVLAYTAWPTALEWKARQYRWAEA
jgi:hypothetical protein